MTQAPDASAVLRAAPAAGPSPAPRLRRVGGGRRLLTGRVVTALMLREMTSTYGKSPGGYVWVVIEPVAGICLLAWVFSLLTRQPPLGPNFMMFYATGWLPFHMFQLLSSRTASALTYSRHLLTYPRVTIFDALASRFLLNLAVQCLVAALILSGVRSWYETGTKLDLGAILLGFAMAGVLAAGVGTINGYLVARFAIWGNIWVILTRPLAIVSGILFLIETVPEPFRSVLMWNPIAHVVAQVRHGFYHGYDAVWVSAAYVLGIGLALLAIGLLFQWRYHRDVQEQ